MSEPDDQQLDAVLKGFLCEALDGQRGRAEQSFRRQVMSETAPRSRWRLNAWMIGSFGFGAAVAASMAVLWASPLLHTTQPRGEAGPRPLTTTAASIPPAIEQVVQSQLVDEGTMVLEGGTPVRVFRRQGVEQTRWFGRDAKVRAQEIVPQDDVVFIKLTTY
jgi:hypothetical protein